MDFLTLATQRYSVRKFKSEPVEQENIDKIFVVERRMVFLMPTLALHNGDIGAEKCRNHCNDDKQQRNGRDRIERCRNQTEIKRLAVDKFQETVGSPNDFTQEPADKRADQQCTAHKNQTLDQIQAEYIELAGTTALHNGNLTLLALQL